MASAISEFKSSVKGWFIYKLAIELANPNIIQVSDRFHLIIGLSEVVREEIKNVLPRQIILDEDIVEISKKVLKRDMKRQKLI